MSMSRLWCAGLLLAAAACVGRSNYVPQTTGTDTPNANTGGDDDEQSEEEEPAEGEEGDGAGPIDAPEEEDPNTAPENDAGAGSGLEPAPDAS